ncbi:MAG: hypothetical protein FWG80_02390 [Alphaproteobacteria bacterium]|nr:hypothetical protein [Alphaproteobacteria bacterium]
MKLTPEQIAVLKENLRLRGSDIRISMAVEEMAELTKELMKHKRGKENIYDITEEIADCFIVLEGLKPTLGIEDSKIQQVIDSKIERLDRRNTKYQENISLENNCPKDYHPGAGRGNK